MSMSKSMKRENSSWSSYVSNLLLTRIAPINCSRRQILFLSLFLILFCYNNYYYFIYIFFNFTDFFFRVMYFSETKKLDTSCESPASQTVWPT